MRIDSITLHEIGPFDDVQIDFPEGTDPNLADVYLLVGPNGCGKTTVLYAIAALLEPAPSLLRPRMRTERSRATIVVSGQERSMTLNEDPDLRAVIDGITVESLLRPLDDYNRAIAHSKILGPARMKMNWAAFAYAGTTKVGSGRVAAVSEPSIDPFEKNLSFQDTANTETLAHWVANQDFKRLKAKEAGREERAEQIAGSVRAIEDAIAKIIEDPSFKFVPGSDTDLDVRVRRHGAVIDMDVLPDGVKSIVSWVADLLMRLDRISWVDDIPITQRPFLLLLDEIDIFLHPAWQRRVIPIVQELFPKAQIIASTHSPFVVASADDAHIITFKMKDGHSDVELIRLSQVGVSYSAVLREIFGIKSEFDIETERMLAEFHEAKTRLLEGSTTDRTHVDEVAAKLTERGEELRSMIGFELRQLDRRLKKQTVG